MPPDYNIEKKTITLRLMAATSAAYCLALGSLPDHGALVVLSVALVLANFALSMQHLARRGTLSLDLIALSAVQLFLFGLLHVQIYTALGAHHYTCAFVPQWHDWVQFMIAHVLRAADILDGIEAYGMSLQDVRGASWLSKGLLVGMHAMVDVFLLRALIEYLRRRKDAGNAVGFLRSVVARLGMGKARHRRIALALPFVCVAIVALFGGWGFGMSFAWVVDNVLRTIDFCDAFQIYGWRLHSLDMGVGLASLAIGVRLATGYLLTPLLVSAILHSVGELTMTVSELAERVADEGAVLESREKAADILAKRGEGSAAAVPSLVKALHGGFGSPVCSAARALGEIGRKAAPAIPDLARVLARADYKRTPASEALEKIDPSWRTAPGLDRVVDDLIKVVAEQEEFQSDRANAALALGIIGPPAAPAVPVLVENLEGGGGEVCLAATRTLGAIGKEAAPAIPKLVRLSVNWDDSIRQAAIESLESIDPDWPEVEGLGEVVSELTECRLRLGPRPDPDYALKRATWMAELLGRMGPRAKPAVSQLVETLKVEDDVYLRVACDALVKIAEDTIPDLSRIVRLWSCRSGNEMGRHAVSVLVRIGLPSIPSLVEALEYRHAESRRAAAEALGQLAPHASAAVPVLVKALADPDETVGAAASEALDAIDPHWLVSQGEAAVANCLNKLEEREACESAIQALGRVKPDWKASALKQEVVCRLVRVLADWGHGRDYGLHVLETLDPQWPMSAGTRQAIPHLIARLGSPEQTIRWGATRTLADLGPSVVPALIAAFPNQESDAKRATVDALDWIKPQTAEVTPGLTMAMADADPQVREDAARALSRLGPLAAASALDLAAALADDSAEVRGATALALERMGPLAATAVPNLVAAMKAEMRGEQNMEKLVTMLSALKKIAPDHPFANRSDTGG
jgi:HEAT repeat protein